MGAITRDSVERVKRQINIYDVVSRVVQLKKAGRQFKGLSPFSNEKTPSFYINPEKNVYYCYSSGSGGDLIRFIEQYEKLTFYEAVETLAERFNVPIEYEQGRGPDKQERSLRKEILDIHDEASYYFHQLFKEDSREAKVAKDYWLEQRQFSMELANQFKIGVTLANDARFIKHLINKKFSLEALKKSGLFYARENETDPHRLRLRFRGRLMVPIRNYQGQVIAFTARQLPVTPEDDPSREAKYINSPETPLFKKGEIVFLLEEARTHLDEEGPCQGTFVLVEGQLDALRCWDKGIKTAIAPQGTAITEEQVHLMRRYTDKLLCILDGDSAGRRAAMRLLPLAVKAGIDIRFMVLDSKDDPDTFLLREGYEGFERRLDGLQSAMSFASTTLIDPQKSSPQERASALSELFEIVNNSELEVTRQDYLNEISRAIRADYDALSKDFENFRDQRKRANLRPESDILITSPTKDRLTTAEYDLLYFIFHHEELGRALAEIIHYDWIDQSLIEGRLLLRVLAEFHEDLWDGINNIDHLLETDEEKNFTYAILSRAPDFEEPVKIANKCVQGIVDKYVRKNLHMLDERIANLANPAEEFPIIIKQRAELRKLRGNVPQIKVSY